MFLHQNEGLFRYSNMRMINGKKKTLSSLLDFQNLRGLVILILLIFNSSLLYSQFTLELIPLDKKATFFSDIISYSSNHRTIQSIKQSTQKTISDLQEKSYWAASIDSLVQKDSTFKAYIFVGNIFKWANIENGNIDKNALDAIGFQERFFSKKVVDISKLNDIKERLLDYAENNGFPFAQVWLGDLNIQKSTIEGKLYWKKSKLITFAEIEIQGNANISKTFLSNYLGIKEGAPYSEQLISNINNRLQSLPYLKQKQSLVVIFKGNVAQVNIFLEKQNASRFDLIIGFLPRNDFTGRPLITGSFQGMLQNPFGTGKSISVDWQRLKAETSRLDIAFSYPYVLNLPFGFDGKLNIYRRDSTLQDTRFNIGIQYLFEGNNYLKIFWKSVANNLLSVNEQQILQSKELPATLDILNTTLGLEYNYRKVNNIINPREGFSIRLLGGAGIKQIRTNASILNLQDNSDPSFDFSALYDSLRLRTFQLNTEVSLAYYQPIGNRFTIKTSLEGGLLFSQDSLYQNEIYRIGGNRLLRGFDEESILSSAYAILTIEPRLLLNETSYLFTLLDYAYLQNRSVGNQISDFPLGFGVGLSLSTPAGIVRVSYAMGRQLGNPVDFQAAKIHFGYVNYF